MDYIIQLFNLVFKAPTFLSPLLCICDWLFHLINRILIILWIIRFLCFVKISYKVLFIMSFCYLIFNLKYLSANFGSHFPSVYNHDWLFIWYLLKYLMISNFLRYCIRYMKEVVNLYWIKYFFLFFNVIYL
uniref:Uncharacterized protein n=1 Tax=Heterorhabditis bacteriophora TaxID=37862 RepID=A0A1I7WB10_HETBA